MQRCLELVGDGLEVRTLLYQKLHGSELLIILGVRCVVQRCPSVRVNDVQLSLAFEYLRKRNLLGPLILLGKNDFVDWSLANDRGFGIDILSAIDQVLEILWVRGLSGVGQGLEHVTSVLVLGNYQWIVSIAG